MKEKAAQKVSVIMPSYNKSAFIGQTIQSVLEQTYQDWELIIVDDCSSDSSLSVIQKYGNLDSRIVLERNTKNSGANYCRNRGIARSEGEFLLFIDADDLLAPECLQNRLAAVKEFADYDFWVFAMGVFYEKIGDDRREWQPSSQHALKKFLSHELPWQTMQPIWRREFVVKIGCWDEQMPRLQDVELHTRALLEPDCRFKVFSGDPDCFLRISPVRKSFSPEDFLRNWVFGANLYYLKFYPQIDRKKRQWLLGTIYRTDMQLGISRKAGQITKNKYWELRGQLYSVLGDNLSALARYLLNLGSLYNRTFVRLPGFNRLLWKIITLN